MSLSDAAGELLTKLTDKATEVAPELAEKGFDSLLDKGEDFLDDSGLDAELVEGGKEALEILKEGKDPFVRLSTEAFGYVLGHFTNNDEEAARNVFIATQADYATRRRWMQEGGDLAQKDREERDAAWEAAKAVLKKVGTFGLKFLLKLVTSQLGLPF